MRPCPQTTTSCGQVVAHLDAAASACVVALSTMHRGPALVRVLREASALQLALLDAGGVDAAALGALMSRSLPVLVELRLSDCPALSSLAPLMALQPQLRSLALSSCDSLTALHAAKEHSAVCSAHVPHIVCSAA